MNQSNRYRLAKRLGLTALALVLGLGLGSVQAGDKGQRHHAEGQYDAATATYRVVAGDDLGAIAERFGITLRVRSLSRFHPRSWG
jgi:LysM repeat protein